MVQTDVLVDICEKDNDRYVYGFNGQLKTNEWAGIGNFMEFAARGQDTRIGRFLAVDPAAYKYPWNSQYAFAENDVIRSVDLEGGEKLVYTFTKKNGFWTKAEAQLSKAGPLGDGVLVKFDNGIVNAYYYGHLMPNTATGKDFTKFYEDKKLDSKGNHIAYTIEGEPHTTIGYGHYNDEPDEIKKYPNGTKITEAEASSLFDKDYSERDITGLGEHGDAALTDYTFTASNDAKKTANRFNGVTSWADRQNFFIDRIGAKSPKVGVGVAKRRSAEQILFTFKKYVGIDYSRPAQGTWKNAYNSLVDDQGKEKVEEKKSNNAPTGQNIHQGN